MKATRKQVTAVVLLVLAVAAAAAAGNAGTGPAFTRVTTKGVGPYAVYSMVRDPKGTLHLIYQTHPLGTDSPNGLATRTISASGILGPEVQALNGWGTSLPGLVQLPNGTYEAFFGAISPAPDQVSDMWAITSGDGTSWSVPMQAGNGDPNTEAQAYGANITAQMAGSTPVESLSVAGGLRVQNGVGQGSPAVTITNAVDGSAFDQNSTVDAASHQVVLGWQSIDGKGGDFVQAVAPTIGNAEQWPGQTKPELVISGRDSGAGVYGAYTPDSNHVRLQRYGGGSVAVGSLSGVTASSLGTATGLDGRIWVIWGNENGIALTRSNKAVTRFEPIQELNLGAVTLYRVGGDGRLGPLDLLVEMIPKANDKVLPAGVFHARVLPELSATTSLKTVKNKAGTVIAHKLTVHVRDAGDPVSGAKVSASGKAANTGATGNATITLQASVSGTVTVTVTRGGYKALTVKALV